MVFRQFLQLLVCSLQLVQERLLLQIYASNGELVSLIFRSLSKPFGAKNKTEIKSLVNDVQINFVLHLSDSNLSCFSYCWMLSPLLMKQTSWIIRCYEVF
jgi:hypothetical protein